MASLEQAITKGISEVPKWQIGPGKETDSLVFTELERDPGGTQLHCLAFLKSARYLRPTHFHAFYCYVSRIAAYLARMKVPGVEKIYFSVSLSPDGARVCK